MESAPYSFLVSVNNPVPVSVPLPAHLPPGAETASTVRSTAARAGDPPLARVHTPRTTQRWSRQAPVPFWIHSGLDDSLLCSVHPAAPDVYDLSTADGAPLARITRRAGRVLPWPRRVRWTAQFVGPSQSVTGRVGTWYSWLIYVVTAPVWFVYALCATVYSFIDGSADDFTFGGPTRTRWRVRGVGTVLDHRGISKTYRFSPQRLDARVAYALAILQTWERKR
ncbi:hypothetical protein [Streptomyces sp. NPDC007206]|uniref:hypothetical protein n=1 Tax=Streptomyces sp. NPDC007206 TaxID=3154317 RepID=UPI00340548FE